MGDFVQPIENIVVINMALIIFRYRQQLIIKNSEEDLIRSTTLFI